MKVGNNTYNLVSVITVIIVSFCMIKCTNNGTENRKSIPSPEELKYPTQQINNSNNAPAKHTDKSYQTPGEKSSHGSDSTGEISAELTPSDSQTLYGVVVWSTANIYSSPDFFSSRIGYFRAGTVILLGERVKPSNPKSPRCILGWYRLVDGPGYICASKGFEIASIITTSPDRINPPTTEELLPYRYGRIMVDFTPLYEKIPTEEEENLVASYVAEQKKLLAMQKKEKEMAEAKVQSEKMKKQILTEMESEQESLSQEKSESEKIKNLTPMSVKKNGSETTVANLNSTESKQEAGEKKDSSAATPFPFVSAFLMKGFYLSIDSEKMERGIKWYRTTRGKYIRYEPVMLVVPQSYHGYFLQSGESFPVGMVLRKNVYGRKWNNTGNHLVKNREKVFDKFFGFRIYRNVVDNGMLHYQIDPDGKDYLLSWSTIVFSKPYPKPPEIPPESKWIHVDISDQTLTAYEGERPVFVTLISSGNEKKDPAFATPRGLFYIISKNITSTMSNLALDDESYWIDDVPWTMYFYKSYALHGAFWHNVFGNQRSHGCINMTLADAKWLFYWTEPYLPLGWHGIYAEKPAKGTAVLITD